MKDWFYNKKRGKGGGGGSGGQGQLLITSASVRVLAPAKAYWKANRSRLREQLISLWKKEQGLVENTDYTGIDEAVVPKLTAEEQEIEDQRILAHLDLGWKTLAVQKWYDEEPQSVKDDIDRRCKSAAGLVEKEADLKVRLERLAWIDGFVTSNIYFLPY